MLLFEDDLRLSQNYLVLNVFIDSIPILKIGLRVMCVTRGLIDTEGRHTTTEWVQVVRVLLIIRNDWSDFSTIHQMCYYKLKVKCVYAKIKSVSLSDNACMFNVQFKHINAQFR